MEKDGWKKIRSDSGFSIKGSGTSKRESFENAAMGAVSIIIDPSQVRSLNVLFIDCEAKNDENLLESWINSLIKEMKDRRILFSKFQVYLEKPKLRGKAWGEPIDLRRHKLAANLFKAQKKGCLVRQVSAYRWISECNILVL